MEGEEEREKERERAEDLYPGHHAIGFHRSTTEYGGTWDRMIGEAEPQSRCSLKRCGPLILCGCGSLTCVAVDY